MKKITPSYITMKFCDKGKIFKAARRDITDDELRIHRQH